MSDGTCMLNTKQKQLGCKKSAKPIRSSIVAIVISDQNLLYQVRPSDKANHSCENA